MILRGVAYRDLMRDLTCAVAHGLLSSPLQYETAHLEDHTSHDSHRSGAVCRPSERAGRAQTTPRDRFSGLAARRARIWKDPARRRARTRNGSTLHLDRVSSRRPGIGTPLAR